jgi:cob(I)alamin adenosyltransferase
MIYSIYGYGKAKTECAIGMMIRSIANHIPVIFAQFLKDGSSSEVKFLRMFNEVTYLNSNTKGFKYGNDDVRSVSNLWNGLCNMVATRNSGLLVLDEILVAYDLGFLSYNKVKKLVKLAVDNGLDVCLTGRMNSKTKRHNIEVLSDVVTNAYAVKHWFNTYCDRCKCEYEYYDRYCPKCGRKLKSSNKTKKGIDF